MEFDRIVWRLTRERQGVKRAAMSSQQQVLGEQSSHQGEEQ
jgi:hypothetical protein